MRAEECGLSRTQLSILIDDWIFSERDRAILKRRLLDGLCYESIADQFGLSVRQVKRIVYKAEERLFKHIKLA
jgi:DNA-directed RNA polymerase specialized sigma24 family protein